MNVFEMARRALVNDLIESTPPRVAIEAQMEVIAEQSEALLMQARAVRAQAEELAARVCCNGRCRQGRDCPLRRQ